MTPEQRAQRKKVKAKLDGQIAAGDAIYAIIAIHRERMFMMDQCKRCELALGAYLRRSEGWSKDLPEDERKVIAVRVQEMLDKGVEPDHPSGGTLIKVYVIEVEKLSTTLLLVSTYRRHNRK